MPCIFPSPLFYADYIPLPLPEGHRFPADKYVKTRDALKTALQLDDNAFQRSPMIDKSALLTTHCPNYIEGIFSGSLEPRAQKRIGFPWSPDFVERSLASTGGTLAAARHALQCGYGAQLAGGTHHAHRDFGGGYCVFNDFAVTANVLLKENSIHRIAIIDLDVHHGDGNASLLADNPNVLVFSMHGAKNYPSKKPDSDIDIALPDGCDDDHYLQALEKALPLVAQFMPDLILYQAGVDALKEDTLGRLNLTHQGLLERDSRVFALAKRYATPIVHVLGGGYSKPIETTVAAYTNTFLAAAEIFGFYKPTHTTS